MVERMLPQCGDEFSEDSPDIGLISHVMAFDKMLNATVMELESSDGAEPALQIVASDPSVEEFIDARIGSYQRLFGPCRRPTCDVCQVEKGFKNLTERGHTTKSQTGCQQGRDFLVVRVAVSMHKIDGVLAGLDVRGQFVQTKTKLMGSFSREAG